MRGNEWNPARGRSGRPWQRLKSIVCPPGSLCALCGKEIMFGMPPRHPLGPSIDHVVSLANGGHPTDLSNLQPAHYGCNAAKGAGINAATRPRSRDY